MDRPKSCMDFLESLPDDSSEEYCLSGHSISEASGLRAYMKDNGVHAVHRRLIYMLIGAAMDSSCPHSRDCVFSLMKEGEIVQETAPEMRDYLREILRPRWEEYHATLMEGIDAAVACGLNESLIGHDPDNPIVPDVERHSVYRMIGEIRRGIRDKGNMSEIFEIFSRYGIKVNVVMEMTHILGPAVKEENEPEAVRGDRGKSE